MPDQMLRPIERTVRRLRQEGLSSSEVAWRLRRTPGYVDRVETLSALERPSDGRPDAAAAPPALRPIERCVLKSLEAGSGYPEIAARLRRTPDYVARIEEFANLKLATG
ncbi:MAG: hypothetical protein OEV40_17900 [Acidimicrobiia bacterium]|nr:hypothetical protein [Acidimicrobiia bacterium]